ncbi:MAG: DUF6519 domain-containing protein [Actinomadura sp.]
MQGDFSRVTFDPAKHFSAVLTQQGRVPLDADANEQGAILLHYLRTLAADLIGPAGTPAEAPDGPGGFQVEIAPGAGTPDLTIGPGRYYVDGLLCENAGGTTYLTQPDGHLEPADPDDRLPDGELPYLVYLRVWERLITALEDPSIREIALSDLGPDTAARARVVWQVACHEYDPEAGDAVAQWRDWLAELHEPKGLLAARADRPNDTDQDVCDLSPDASYRGPENQLYRVEIHTGGVAAALPDHGPATAKALKEGGPFATFKWSRDNGSVVFPIVSISGSAVELATLGRDGKLGLEVGDQVEIVDDAYACRVADDVPPGSTPQLRRITAIDPVDRLVTLDAAVSGSCGTDPGLHPLLRRWDHRASERDEFADDGAIPLVEGAWLDLEDGVQVRFDPPPVEQGDGGVDSPAPARYRRGDHWLIPARTVTGDVVWPQDAHGPAARPPHGVDYHYAPLATIEDGAVGADLRSLFAPLVQAPEAAEAPATDTASGTPEKKDAPDAKAGAAKSTPATAEAKTTQAKTTQAGKESAARRPAAGKAGTGGQTGQPARPARRTPRKG